MMDISQRMRELASDVGNDYSLHAPDDIANLIGKARRGRVVWSAGVGAVATAGAATLAFGAPAVASVITSNSQLEPAGPATESASVSPLPSVPVAPETSAEPSPSHSTVQPTSPGTIDLTGGATHGDDEDDDAYEDDDDSSDDDAYEDDDADEDGHDSSDDDADEDDDDSSDDDESSDDDGDDD